MRRDVGILGFRYAIGSVLVFGLCLPESAGADQPANRVGIVSVTPALLDSVLVCGISTRGIPDDPSRETLRSGLPSALIFGLSVLDASGKDIGSTRAEIRIEPDLWENIFFLNTPAADFRASSMSDVEALLANINPIPILPLNNLRPDDSYRILVRLAVHPLAPSEIRRSRGLFAGDAGLADPDRREISIGLTSLLRFFLGKADDEDWVAEAESAVFTRRMLLSDRAPSGEDN